MKRKSAGFLAGVLVASMVATPLSYANVYAEDQDAKGIVQQETEEVSSDTGHAQEESTAVKEESKEELKTEEDITSEQPEDNAGVLETEAGNPETEISQGSQMTEAETKVTETPVQPTVDIDDVKVLKNDGSEYGMFPVVVDKMEVKDDQVKVSFHTGTKKVFDWLYLGSVTDTEKNNYIVGNNTGSTFNDFVIVSSKAVLRGENIRMTLDVKGNKWTKIYLGVQADTDKTPVYKGTYDLEKNVTTFTFDIQAEKQGMNIAITPGNEKWFTWARDLFINIPNLENRVNTTAEGVYNLYGSAYPTTNSYSLNFERESSVSISGDQATVTWVTQAGLYDRLYIGNTVDSDEVKEANAIVPQDRSDIASGYKSFTFTMPVSELGKEFSYSVRSAKTGQWLSLIHI